MRRRQASGWAMAAGSAAVVAVGLAAGTGPIVHSTTGPAITFPAPPTTAPGAATTIPKPSVRSIPPPVTAPPSTHSGEVVMAVVAAVVAVAVVALATRALLRWLRMADDEPGAGGPGDGPDASMDDPGGDGPAGTAGGLLTGVEEAAGALDDEHDPRQAVMACWLRLERAVADSGAPRAPSESPGELTRRVMLSYAVDRDQLQSLYHLYGRARYSLAPVPAAARDQARSALDAIRAGLVRLAERPAP